MPAFRHLLQMKLKAGVFQRCDSLAAGFSARSWGPACLLRPHRCMCHLSRLAETDFFHKMDNDLERSHASFMGVEDSLNALMIGGYDYYIRRARYALQLWWNAWSLVRALS